MKNLISLAVCLTILFSLVGCTFPLARPMPLGTGVVYSNLRFSDDGYPVNDALVGSRKGKSSMSEILCCFASGNASVTRAAQDAGITKIKTVEHQYFNILLIYQSYTTFVTGEE